MRYLLSGILCLLLLPACGDDESSDTESISVPTSFGVQYRYSGPPVEGGTDQTVPSVAGSGCVPPGARQNSGGVRIDQDGPLPHLWLRARSTGNQAPIAVDVILVKAYLPGTMLPAESETLRSGSYDAVFAGSSRRDAFAVVFKGQTYGFEITGVPPHRAQCPTAAS